MRKELLTSLRLLIEDLGTKGDPKVQNIKELYLGIITGQSEK